LARVLFLEVLVFPREPREVGGYALGDGKRHTVDAATSAARAHGLFCAAFSSYSFLRAYCLSRSNTQGSSQGRPGPNLTGIHEGASIIQAGSSRENSNTEP